MLKYSLIAASLLVLTFSRTFAQESSFPSVPGWTVSLESRVYDANDLWDIIDGAADLYLEYAFIDLHLARYKTPDGREVKVECYRHRDAENAFGIYAAERSPEYHFIRIGAQGYQQTSVLNFVDGEFYLKLSSYQSDSASVHDLQTIARALESHVKRDAVLPSMLGLFPTEGKLDNSEQFIAQNFLGYGFLRSVYTASYASGSVGIKAFIMVKHSPEEADTTLSAYLSKVPKEAMASAGALRFDIQDPNNGPISIARQGRYLFGTLNCADASVNTRLMAGLKSTLSSH